MRRIRGILLASVMMGCYAHVDLQAPPATAPLEERLEAYHHLLPGSYSSNPGIGADGQPQIVSFSSDSLLLSSGVDVHFAEDLLPVVPAESPIVSIIESSRDKRRAADGLLISGITAYAVGTFAGAAGLISIPFAGESSGGISPAITLGLIFGGIGLELVGSGLAIGSGFVRRGAFEKKATAFELFPGALGKRLNLCGPINHVGDCGQSL